MKWGCFRDTQDTQPAFYCSHCHNEIYNYDDCYLVGGNVVCSDCLEDFEKETRHSITGYELNDYLNHLYEGLEDIE